MAVTLAEAPQVTSDHAVTFARDGAVKVAGLLDARWIEHLRGIFDELLAEAADLSGYYADDPTSPQDAPGATRVRDANWMASPAMRTFLFDSPIAEAAARVIGSTSATIYEDLLIYKAPGAEQPTPWHQDEPQWPVTGRQMGSVWLSLEPVTRETGALRFVAGSHRGPLHIPYVPKAMRERLEPDLALFDGGPLPDIDADPARRVVSYACEPGDVVIFHPRVIHGAFGSASDRPRRTFSIRFLGDDVRWQEKASVVYGYLAESGLKTGDRVTGPRFPRVWPASGTE